MIPGRHSDHMDLRKTFGFAFQGFRIALATERNIRIMLAVSLITIICGFLVKLDALGWLVVLLGSGVVLSAELLNTALENVVDLVSPEFHPLAGRAKDLGAAAVWVLSLFVALAGLMVFARALGLMF